MGKLSNNELYACIGGNILTSFTKVFIGMVSIAKRIAIFLGGRR